MFSRAVSLSLSSSLPPPPPKPLVKTTIIEDVRRKQQFALSRMSPFYRRRESVHIIALQTPLNMGDPAPRRLNGENGFGSSDCMHMQFIPESRNRLGLWSHTSYLLVSIQNDASMMRD